MKRTIKSLLETIFYNIGIRYLMLDNSKQLKTYPLFRTEVYYIELR